MSGTFFRPLGAQRLAPGRLSRRLFIGATVAAPVALLIQPGHASADETTSSEFKFIEDEEGLSILLAPKGVTKATWRLHRSAFGPETKFTLRTLQAGSEKGYELEIAGLTFGRRKRRHLIVIFRSGEEWEVRMRSDLWCAPECELVSEPDILFTQLASSDEQRHTGVCKPKAAFCFEVHASEISAEMQKVLEGQIEISGRLLLDLDADGVWHFTPHQPAGITTLPAGLPLSTLALAWCERAEDSDSGCKFEIADTLHPLGAPGTNLGSRPGDDPIFCAGGTVSADVKKAQFRCVGTASFSASIEADSPQKLVFTFLRRDWTEDEDARKRGFSELQGGGQWVLRTQFDSRVTLDSVLITKGVLRAWHEPKASLSNLAARISGEVASSPATVGSRIGALCVQGSNSPAPDDEHRLRVDLRYPDAPSHQAAIATSVQVPLLLLESDIALPGADFSRLSFQSSPLLARWAPAVDEALAREDGYLWLGSVEALKGKPLARVDLTRARLEASRSIDLLRLTFSFSGVYLDIGDGGPMFTLASSTCRVLRRQAPTSNTQLVTEPETIDSRPTLVVEFPPQHVFEETLFRPSGADLPEVRLKESKFKVSSADLSDAAKQKLAADPTGAVLFSTQPTDFLRELDEFTNTKDRIVVRQQYAKLKQAEEVRSGVKVTPFADISLALVSRFTTAFGGAPTGDSPPSHADQAIYIGPYGMDPDVAALARDEMAKLQNANLQALIDDVFKKADRLADGFAHPPPAGDQSDFAKLFAKVRDLVKQWTHALTGGGTPVNLDLALLREKGISQILPDYAYFRDFYREQMTSLYLEPDQTGRHETEYQEKVDRDLVVPKSTGPTEIEYFTANNRSLADADPKKSAARDTYVRTEYLSALKGSDKIPINVRARLANPSRLAFRLNCDPPGLTSFHLDTLTDWSKHELAVTPRAQSVVAFDEGGQPLPDASDSADQSANENKEGATAHPEAQEEQGNASGGQDQAKEEQDQVKGGAEEDIEMLRLLGIRSGQYVTSQERLTDVEASLRRPPGPLETAIEIPARLILSPSQRALWRTSPAPSIPAIPKKARSVTRGPIALWGADLVTDNPYPTVRAVHSPDLRPGFVRSGLEHAASEGSAARRAEAKKLPLHTTALHPPPRGPRAPWTLGVEEGDPTTSSLEDIERALGESDQDSSAKGGKTDADGKEARTKEAAEDEADAKKADAKDVCSSPSADAKTNTHPLVEYLRRRQADIKGYKARGIFRSSLDAYDRHELVLLTSAFGLPVLGRREQNGQLINVALSSQVEPPAHLRPIDLDAGTALYRPRSLNLRELRLTALGGTLHHDTDFIPPAAALHIEYGALFDSLSIERWQHWVVLGRDVYSEVVYKGFLFPIGHRASLVKQTERVFLRSTVFKSIRAFLRQRMFIRVGQPDKTFPALGQPNLGRQFPGGLVHILTTVTPDLVDPSQDSEEQKDALTKDEIPAPSGRLFASKGALVFWPRTARIAGAEVRFEALLNGAFVKLPLIFADNRATHDTDIMSSLVTYYRRIRSPDSSPEALEAVISADHLRTIDLGGQSLRYCDELKPGSATHRTLYWTLSASGGVRTPPPQNLVPASGDSSRTDDLGWEGSNDEFTDPTLEGADQPPFYPVIETARIRLDQVERMSAQSMVVALVRFDGYYVAKGFTPDQKSATAKDPYNPLGIYLNVLNDVPFQMGAAGDRSGGLFRPASTVVALCRARGPLCGDAKFSKGPTLTTVVAEYSEAGTAVDPRKQVYTNYFSSRQPSDPKSSILETKLLGVVTLKDLVGAISHFEPGNEGLPLLREVVRYGIPDTSNVSEAIRRIVLDPLNKATAELQSRLDGLDSELKRNKSPLGEAITIDSVFPEVTGGLRDFRAALGKSIQTADGADFYSSLADVYETGHRLGDALERASANPIERVYVAVARQMRGQLEKLLQAPLTLAKSLRDGILTSVGDLKNKLPQTVADLVVGDAQDRERFLPLPFALRNQAAKIPWTGPDSVHDALESRLRDCLAGQVPESCVKGFVQDFTSIVNKAIADANTDQYVPTITGTVTPLFQLASRIAQQFDSGTGPDPAAFATLAEDCLSLFAPIDEGRFVDDILGALNDLSKKREAIVKTLSYDAPTPHLVGTFVKSATGITIPSIPSPPPDEFRWVQPNIPTLIGALYQFGVAARDTLVS